MILLDPMPWVFCAGVRAWFQCRDGVPDDETVLREVWEEQVYVTRRDELEAKRVLDLGANIGAFTVLALACGAKSVTSYEPNRSNFDRLGIHTLPFWDPDFGPEVNMLRQAVADKTGTGLLAGSGGAAHLVQVPDGQAVNVEVAGIHDVIRDYGPFDVVKIDVEGGEWPILNALIQTEMAGVGSIIAEHHGPLMHTIDRDNLEAVEVEQVVQHGRMFGDVIGQLAEFGHVEVLGRPSVGGTLRWRSYSPPEQEDD